MQSLIQKIILEKNEEIIESDSNGGGPVDATFKAIEKIVKAIQTYNYTR